MEGIINRNQLPNYEDFNSLINGKKEFTAIEKAKLWSSDSDMSKMTIHKEFVITSIKSENGIILLNADLQDENKYKTFRIVSFEKEYFNIYYEDKSTAYNIKIKI